jgi:hypothetical protein
MLCGSHRRTFASISYALQSTEDQKIDYHEGVDEHERYLAFVSSDSSYWFFLLCTQVWESE